MGNHASCVTVGNTKETIQLVRSDGNVEILHKPLYVGQIIEGFPLHLVFHSHSFYISQKMPALSPHGQLKLGNKYFLLPNHCFQSPLSLISLTSLISMPLPSPLIASSITTAPRVSTPLRSIGRATVLYKSFDIQKSEEGGGLQIRICPEFISNLVEDIRLNIDESHGHSVGRGSADMRRRLCSTPELQRDYAHLVKSRGQCWRPTLESISENEKKVGPKIFKKIKRSGQISRWSSL